MNLLEKLKENLLSVLPIVAIVILLNFTIAPVAGETMIRFVMGSGFVIIGLSLFLAGAEMGVLPMGEAMGSTLSQKGNVWLIVMVGFLVGFGVTVAEPDVQVLASQVFEVSMEEVPKILLIMTVAAGAGVFVVVGLLRTLFNLTLSKVLLISYILVFILALFTSPNFLSVGFDAGGVTTGPMTVPFVLALGLGVASVRGGKSNHDDSFGLVSMVSIGPILAVLLLGVFQR